MLPSAALIKLSSHHSEVSLCSFHATLVSFSLPSRSRAMLQRFVGPPLSKSCRGNVHLFYTPNFARGRRQSLLLVPLAAQPRIRATLGHARRSSLRSSHPSRSRAPLRRSVATQTSTRTVRAWPVGCAGWLPMLVVVAACAGWLRWLASFAYHVPCAAARNYAEATAPEGSVTSVRTRSDSVLHERHYFSSLRWVAFLPKRSAWQLCPQRF